MRTYTEGFEQARKDIADFGIETAKLVVSRIWDIAGDNDWVLGYCTAVNLYDERARTN